MAGLVWFWGTAPLKATPFFTNTPLHITRAYHTTTLLQNGKLLVAGGYNGSMIAISELYDPATGICTTNGTLTTARYQHTATLLTNGLVLVTGGLQTASGGGHISQNAIASAELYDPVAGTWSATGSLNFDRWGHTATLLQNGQVLAAAGIFLGVISSAELYNPATKTWTTTGGLNTGRVYHTGTLLPGGKALVVSGYYNYGAGLTTNSAEIYDPVTTNWTVAGLVNKGTPVWHRLRFLPTAIRIRRQNRIASITETPDGSVMVRSGSRLWGARTLRLQSSKGRWSCVEVIKPNSTIQILSFPPNRVSEGIAPHRLPHHRTCGSAYGGSCQSLRIKQHSFSATMIAAQGSACRPQRSGTRPPMVVSACQVQPFPSGEPLRSLRLHRPIPVHRVEGPRGFSFLTGRLLFSSLRRNVRQ